MIPCGVVFRSVGYHGVGVPGTPFDERAGTMPNAEGRVLVEDGAAIPGLYCAGWIKRGPTGVIGTNKKDATETVELLLEDARAGRLPERSGENIDNLLADRGVQVVTYAGWESIDAAEKARGEPQGRPRVKLARGTSCWARLEVRERAASDRISAVRTHLGVRAGRVRDGSRLALGQGWR